MAARSFSKSESAAFCAAQSSPVDQFPTLYWAQRGKVWRVAERILAPECSENMKAYPTKSFECCQTTSQALSGV